MDTVVWQLLASVICPGESLTFEKAGFTHLLMWESGFTDLIR